MCMHCIGLVANPEEMRKLEAIKAHHRRRSTSDVIRFLIEKEADIILPKNVPVGTKKQETDHDLAHS